MAAPTVATGQLTANTYLARAAQGYGLLAKRLLDGHYPTSSHTLGAEVEGSFFTGSGNPAFIANSVLASPGLPNDIVAELMACHFEINVPAFSLTGRPFSQFIATITQRLAALTAAASQLNGRIGFMGIAPTMTAHMLVAQNYSANPRYHQLRRWAAAQCPRTPNRLGAAGANFKGDNRLDIEGANASLQVHLSVGADQLAGMFNAAHLAAPYVLAASGGSPYLLGERWGAETRIPVFEQATNDRAFFGDIWAKSALDPFRWSMAYSPILTPDIDPLSAFKLLHGTVWRWIRPVMFENALTLEIRPLSTGPTATDMAANAAFLVGLTLHYYQLITGITQNLALARVKDSFYAAARNGLNAQFSYNHHGTPQRPTAVNEVLPQLVDEAQTALIANGVDPAEAQAHLDGIRYRLANGQTAASWLGQTITRYGPQAATTHYLRQSCGGLGPAVATWPLSY